MHLCSICNVCMLTCACEGLNESEGGSEHVAYWWMDVMLQLIREVIQFSFSLLELLQKRQCALHQEIKFSWIVSSSVAGIMPLHIGLPYHNRVFVNQKRTAKIIKRTRQVKWLAQNHFLTYASQLKTVISSIWPDNRLHHMWEWTVKTWKHECVINMKIRTLMCNCTWAK